MANDLFASNEGLDVSQPVAGADLFADPNKPGAFKRGLGAGVAGVKASIAGAGALVARGATSVAQAVGATGVADTTAGLEQSLLAKSAAESEVAAAGSMSYEDVLADPSRSAEYFKFLLGSAVPSLATMAVGGGLGALAGRAVAGQAGIAAARAAGVVAPAVRAGALTGAVLPDVALEAGSIFPEALDTGVENPGLRALAGGAAAGAMDFVPLLAAEKYLKPIGKGGLGALAMGAAKGAPVGAALEGSQELTQALIERAAAGKSLTDPEAVSDYINSFLGGAAPGSVFGAAIGVRRQSRAPVTIDQPPAADPNPVTIDQPPAVNPNTGTIDPNLGTPLPSATPAELHAQLTAEHTTATDQLAALEPQVAQAQAAHDAAVARRDELAVEAKLPIGDRRTMSEITVEKKAVAKQIEAAKKEAERLGGEFHTARETIAGLTPRLEAATRLITPLQNDGTSEQVPSVPNSEVVAPTVASEPNVSDTIQTPSVVVPDAVQPVPVTELSQLRDHIATVIAEKKIPDAKKVEHAAHIDSVIAAVQQGAAAVDEDIRPEWVTRKVFNNKDGIGFRLPKVVKDDIVGHILKQVAQGGRETITPAEDTSVGQNAAGEHLYDRADGSRYRMKEGRPDFGGDLAPVGQAKTQYSKGATEVGDLSKRSVDDLRGLEKQIGDAYVAGKMTDDEFRAQSEPVIYARVRAELRANKMAPAKGILDVFPGFKQIPTGTKIRATHGTRFTEPTMGTVVGSRPLKSDVDGMMTLHPVVDFGDGKGRTVLPSSIKEVFAPRAVAESNAALTQDEFDTLPEPAKFAAVDEFNRVMMAKGTRLRERLLQLIGYDPTLKISTFMATADSPIGSYTRVGPLKSVITLALNAKDELSIADHEGYHYAEDRLLDARERRIVANAMKPGRPLYNQLIAKLQAYDQANGTNLTDEVSAIPAEARAYAFEFWRRGELKAEGPIARAFQAIRNFLEKVSNLVRGLGFTSIEDVFTALDRGQFAERSRSEATTTGTELAMQASKGADQTQSPEFKRWFGDSKVVDAEGRPLVVYHGTDQNFSSFGTQESLTLFRNLGIPDGTFFFTDSPNTAATYAQSDIGTDGGNLMPVYLAMKNPFRVDAKGAQWLGITQKAIGKAADAKNDGVIIDNVVDDIEGTGAPSTVYIVFKQGQIKSSIGNSGQFDPNNPNILYSKGAIADATRSAFAEMTTRFQNGELERTQLQQAWTTLNDNAELPDATFKYATGLVKAEAGGLRDWWFKHIATPNYVSRFSAGYKNVMNTLNTYIRYRKILAEQMLREKLPSWYKASDVDRKAAFGVMLKRTVEGYSKGSNELAALMEPLNAEQRKLYDQATSMIEGFLRAQFAKDQITRRTQLTSEGAYEKWEAERRAQVDSMVDKGYVPLRRYGDYSVRVFYEAPDGKRTDVGLIFVDTARGQHTMATVYQEEIARSGANLKVEIGTRDKNQRETGVSIEQFLGTLRRNSVEISQTERERLVLAMTNSESMIRNKMMHREGLSGYSEDSMRVLHEFGVNMSGELAYARFADAIDAAAEGRVVTADVNSSNSEPEITIDEPLKNPDGSWAETAEQYKGRSLWKSGDPKSGFYNGLADELSNYVLVPDHSGGWSRRLRAAAMVYFIGGSLSGAVVNMMSIPMLLVPELSIHTGYSNSLATTMGAWKDAWRYYHILHDMEKLKSDDPKYAIPGIDANLRQAIAAAADHIFDTEIHQMLGMSQGTVYSKSRNVQRAMEAWMLPFRVAEQTNRLASFIAAYRVATTGEGVKGRGKLYGQELFKFASGIVDATQNNYNESNRPGVARNPVFSLMFQFKSFPLFMTEAILLMHKQNPRSAVYMLLGLTMMTGVQGLPFAETILDLIDTISQRIFNSPFNARRALRNTIKAGSEAMVGADLSEVVLRGMLNDVLGVSMASRIGAGDFVPGSRIGTADADKGRVLSDMLGAPFAMVKDAASNAGKFAGGVFTGDWKEVADAIRAGGPVALRNLVKGAEQLNSGFAMDSRGRVITDVSTVDGLLQMGGLSSAKVARMFDMETINIQTKAFHTQFSQDLQQQLVAAMKAGDSEKVQEISELRAAWNEQYPQMPIMANASATRRAIILSGVPLDQRSRMLWGRRIQGANIFSEDSGN